jgi:hypothetical protein
VGEIGIDRLYAEDYRSKQRSISNCNASHRGDAAEGSRDGKSAAANPAIGRTPERVVIIHPGRGKWYDAKIVRPLEPNRVEVELPMFLKREGPAG